MVTREKGSPVLMHRRLIFSYLYTSIPIIIITGYMLMFSGCSGKQKSIQNFSSFFARVQMSGIFNDSKTFADCVPKTDTAAIIRAYNASVKDRNFDLKTFVLHHFELPPGNAVSFQFDSAETVPGHIDTLWTVLTRHTGIDAEGSLLPLPYAYVVPGGRFREVYYWDSYFTMLGLKLSGRYELIRDMVGNFSYELHNYGFIPNGNRTYYLSRSQPPFFSLMVDLLAEIDGDSVYSRYLSAMETEYRFWMKGRDKVGPQHRSWQRVVYMNDSLVLNRYWDNEARPRPESFREDSTLALTTGREPSELYRNLRAACESGWDFSSRWLAVPDSLGSIITTRIVPVDLNCLLLHLEETIARAWQIQGVTDSVTFYKNKAIMRKRGIRTYFWNKDAGYFCDYNYVNGKNTTILSLAGAYPLCFNVATKEEADQTATVIHDKLLEAFGVVTSRMASGQQWDYPNGWPPMQYITVQGLENYNMNALADIIRNRFEDHCLMYLYRKHKFVEKYNVVRGMAGKGGEYPTQDGFGWTNGVVMQFLDPMLDTVQIK
ncbi:MAG TPA: alpha,alpha-trehalase TreF, partial [Bacteroidales bacterium]|nr:alpha,alpha-trehalase TreF [Bacteroidales bacterium]